MKLGLLQIAGWQVLASLIGMAACAFPSSVWERGFWGTGRSASSLDPGVMISQIEPGSPAALAGLKEYDRILAVNGQTVGYDGLDNAWRRAPVGSEVELRVLRPKRDKADEEKTLVLRTVRSPDPLAGKVYWGWQFVAGFTFLAVAAVVVATQPLVRLAPWRGAVVVLVCFGLAVSLVAVRPQDWGWQTLSQYVTFGHSADFVTFSWQWVTALAVAVLLVFLGALDLRKVFTGGLNHPLPQTPPP